MNRRARITVPVRAGSAPLIKCTGTEISGTEISHRNLRDEPVGVSGAALGRIAACPGFSTFVMAGLVPAIHAVPCLAARRG